MDRDHTHQRRTVAVTAVLLVVGRRLICPRPQRCRCSPRMAATPCAGPGAQGLGRRAVAACRPRSPRVEGRDVWPPLLRDPAVWPEHLVVPRVPVGVGQDRSIPAHGVQESTDHGVGAVERRTNCAQRRVCHDRVPGTVTRPLEVLTQTGPGAERAGTTHRAIVTPPRRELSSPLYRDDAGSPTLLSVPAHGVPVDDPEPGSRTAGWRQPLRERGGRHAGGWTGWSP